jgi:hypothetical protein
MGLVDKYVVPNARGPASGFADALARAAGPHFGAFSAEGHQLRSVKPTVKKWLEYLEQSKSEAPSRPSGPLMNARCRSYG